MKTYASKASAKKGAKRQSLDIATLNFIEVDGRWGWEVAVDTIDQEYINDFGTCTCPHCNVHLSNGVAMNEPGEYECDEFEYACLGCGGEFGPEIGKLQVEAPKGTGIQIEKDRPEQNGVIRPSVGGKCRAIWTACDNFRFKTGRVPMPKEIKELATEEGWNPNNAVIEMYQWRKFNGFNGRQK